MFSDLLFCSGRRWKQMFYWKYNFLISVLISVFFHGKSSQLCLQSQIITEVISSLEQSRTTQHREDRAINFVQHKYSPFVWLTKSMLSYDLWAACWGQMCGSAQAQWLGETAVVFTLTDTRKKIMIRHIHFLKWQQFSFSRINDTQRLRSTADFCLHEWRTGLFHGFRFCVAKTSSWQTDEWNSVTSAVIRRFNIYASKVWQLNIYSAGWAAPWVPARRLRPGLTSCPPTLGSGSCWWTSTATSCVTSKATETSSSENKSRWPDRNKAALSTTDVYLLVVQCLMHKGFCIQMFYILGVWCWSVFIQSHWYSHWI